MPSTNDKPTIFFDLDGTLYDLYGRPNWLEEITTLKDPSAYADEDAVLVDMVRLHEIIFQLMDAGYRIGVISWLAKGATKEYDSAVRATKKVWIRKFLPMATEVHIVKYGTPKHHVMQNVHADAILVDDSAEVREAWTRGIAIDATGDIIEALATLL